MRKLTKQTIKPVWNYCKNGGGFNAEGAKYYSFTLDTYNGKNSWQGGFDWCLDDALKYEAYAIELESGNVFNQSKEVLFNVSEVKP